MEKEQSNLAKFVLQIMEEKIKAEIYNSEVRIYEKIRLLMKTDKIEDQVDDLKETVNFIEDQLEEAADRLAIFLDKIEDKNEFEKKFRTILDDVRFRLRQASEGKDE